MYLNLLLIRVMFMFLNLGVTFTVFERGAFVLMQTIGWDEVHLA